MRQVSTQTERRLSTAGYTRTSTPRLSALGATPREQAAPLAVPRKPAALLLDQMSRAPSRNQLVDQPVPLQPGQAFERNAQSPCVNPPVTPPRGDDHPASASPRFLASAGLSPEAPLAMRSAPSRAEARRWLPEGNSVSNTLCRRGHPLAVGWPACAAALPLRQRKGQPTQTSTLPGDHRSKVARGLLRRSPRVFGARHAGGSQAPRAHPGHVRTTPSRYRPSSSGRPAWQRAPPHARVDRLPTVGRQNRPVPGSFAASPRARRRVPPGLAGPGGGGPTGIELALRLAATMCGSRNPWQPARKPKTHGSPPLPEPGRP